MLMEGEGRDWEIVFVLLRVGTRRTEAKSGSGGCVDPPNLGCGGGGKLTCF